MISKFFIERPIFANVIAFVTIIIGMVCFYICRWRSTPHRAADHPGFDPLPRGQRRSGGRYGGGSHRTGGERGEGLPLSVFYQRQRRELHLNHHL